jgi:hypothetical protein
MVPQAILGAQGDTQAFIDDGRIAQTTRISLRDMRDWFLTMDHDELVELLQVQPNHPIRLMHSGTSFPGSFTSLLTGYASISSVGNGTRSGWSRFGSFTVGSSHRSYADLGTMTGIRSWIGARTSLASVVSKVQE